MIIQTIIEPKHLIERRSFPPCQASLSFLPFVGEVKVSKGKTRRSFWRVPKTDNYGEANQVGRQYACDFVQYIKQNPQLMGGGLLGNIVEDMGQYKPGDAMNGYSVGFLTFLTQLLYTTAHIIDHYAIAEKDAQRYVDLKAKLKADREAEGETA